MSTSPRKAAGATSGVFGDEQQLADRVMRIYTIERRLLEGNYTGTGSQYTPHPRWGGREGTLESAPRFSTWLKIARFLITRNLGPIDYLARQFDQYTSLSKPLNPNELLGDVAWERYATSKKTKHQDLAIEKNSALAKFRCKAEVEFSFLQEEMTAKGLTNDEAESQTKDNILESRLYALYCGELPPLFVYGIACKLVEDAPDDYRFSAAFMDNVEVQAALQYIRFREDYDDVWGNLIPPGFGKKAEELYKQLLGLAAPL